MSEGLGLTKIIQLQGPLDDQWDALEEMELVIKRVCFLPEQQQRVMIQTFMDVVANTHEGVPIGQPLKKENVQGRPKDNHRQQSRGKPRGAGPSSTGAISTRQNLSAFEIKEKADAKMEEAVDKITLAEAVGKITLVPKVGKITREENPDHQLVVEWTSRGDSRGVGKPRGSRPDSPIAGLEESVSEPLNPPGVVKVGLTRMSKRRQDVNAVVYSYPWVSLNAM